jgi:hypothetical protein
MANPKDDEKRPAPTAEESEAPDTGQQPETPPTPPPGEGQGPGGDDDGGTPQGPK